MRRFGYSRRDILPKAAAFILALIMIFAFAASAFAKSGDSSDAPVGDTTTTGAEPPAGDTTTIGAEPSSGQQSSSDQDGSTESDAELEKRKEIYAITALIAMGAILVGIRERRRGK